MSLLQSRDRGIHEAVESMYAEAAKNPESLQNDKAGSGGSKKAINNTIDVIINVKKIKRDLHIQ